jgi:hypothetical protein
LIALTNGMTGDEGTEVTMRAWHMLLCSLPIAAAVVVGARDTGAAAVTPAAGCAATMATMVWTMMRAGGR